MPLHRSYPKMMHRAAELRQQMTPAEKILWDALRGEKLRGITFRRSHAIGRAIADFCCPQHKLVIELDGSPHLTQQAADAERTQYLQAQGYRVIRFWNSQVIEDLSSVLHEITIAIQQQQKN